MEVLSRRATLPGILRVLVSGFAVVIALLVASAGLGLENARLLQENAASLVADQKATTRLIAELEREQALLNATLYRISRYQLAREPAIERRNLLMAELDDADSELHRLVASSAGTPRQALWGNLERASTAFSSEGRRVLLRGGPSGASSRDLFRLHEEVTAAVARLIAAGYGDALETQTRIEGRSRGLVRDAGILLLGGLLLAVVGAVVTLRMTARLFRTMAAQDEELQHVTWRLLETQESVARRFSHELHDELGQALAALKANLSSMATNGGPNPERQADCARLVDDAIGNVRELSQLLRPTILDDFGLDAGLRWLVERFGERTGVTVHYDSSIEGRLAEATETHLFRIVQEALTNVARHAHAKSVWVALRGEGERVHLTIRDDGTGLPEGVRANGLGLRGMEARARGAGGTLALRPAPGGGLEIDVVAARKGVDA